MANDRRIIKKYVRKELNKGHAHESVKKHLMRHGYSSQFISKLIREIKFVNGLKITLLIAFLMAIAAGIFMSYPSGENQITGFAVNEINVMGGCCEDICQQGQKSHCFGTFHEGQECGELNTCLLGCCIDQEGYCIANYLQGNCAKEGGTFVSRQCTDIPFCSHVTDKPVIGKTNESKKNLAQTYLSNKNIYSGSFLAIRHLIYDSSDVLQVKALLRKGTKTVDTIFLYDDGHHNDIGPDDDVYGNNWDSSKANFNEPLSILAIDIIITSKDGSITALNNTNDFGLLTNTKCFPLGKSASKLQSADKNIIFVGQNYGNFQSNFPEFREDVDRFLFFTSLIPPDLLGGFSSYRLDKFPDQYDSASLKSSISDECSSFQQQQDFIIIFDNANNTCTEMDGIIRTNPNLFFTVSISNKDFSDSIKGLCSHVITENELLQIINNSLSLPTIELAEINNSSFNSSPFNITFSITDKNYPNYYTLFFDGTPIKNGTAISSHPVSVLIEHATPGEHGLQIKSQNTNNLFSYSDVATILIHNYTS